jgi:plastocyanin
MRKVHTTSTARQAAKAHDEPRHARSLWIGMALIFVGLMAIASALAAATPDPAPSPAASPVVVSIKDFAFSPQSVTVRAGSTVTWKNLDDEPHTVRGADAQIRSDALDQDETYSVTFDKPGTYKYGCSIHPKMSGTVIVQ